MKLVHSACWLNVVHMASRTLSTAPSMGCEAMPVSPLQAPLISVYVYFTNHLRFVICLSSGYKIPKNMNLISQSPQNEHPWPYQPHETKQCSSPRKLSCLPITSTLWHKQVLSIKEIYICFKQNVGANQIMKANNKQCVMFPAWFKMVGKISSQHVQHLN